MIEWMNGLLVDLQQLIQAGVAVAAAVFVAARWWRTKALVPTITAMVMAGAVVWASANVAWFEDRIAEETQVP